jgi:KDO2-lipid IV(A) lauroyltransferase
VGADLPMFPKGRAGAKGAMAHLMKGGYLGLLIDQKMNDGIESILFGHSAMTAPALAALALRFRCPVIPGYMVRLGPARLKLVVEPPLPLPDTGDRHEDLATLTRQVNACLERWITAAPADWLWFHRRWPKSLYRVGPV